MSGKKIAKIELFLSKILKTDVRSLTLSNIWLSLTRVVSVTTGIFLTIGFANLLSPDEFGYYKYIIASAGIILSFTLSGLNTAATRAVAQHRDEVIRPIFRFGVLASVPATIIALGISVYYFWQGNIPLGIGFLMIGLTNPLLSNLGISKSILLGKEAHRKYAIYNSLGTIIPVLLLLSVLFITKNALFMIIGYFVINTISGLLIYLATLRTCNIPHSNSFPKEDVKYGAHMSGVGFLGQVSAHLDQILLWHFVGPVAVANYALGLAPIRELRTVIENMFPIIFPRFARIDKEEVKKRIPLRTAQFFILCVGAASVYVLLAPTFYKYLFPQYLDSVVLSQLLAITILLLPKGIIETFLAAHGAVRIRYIISVVSAASKIGGFFLLIPLFGIEGAIYAIILSEAVSALILFTYYKKF